MFPPSDQRRRCLGRCSKSKLRTSRSLLRSPSGMEGVVIIDVVIITLVIIYFSLPLPLNRTEHQSHHYHNRLCHKFCHKSLSPVKKLSQLFRASGHTLDKNSFSFETGVPTALSTEDFYEDQQKVTNTLAMIMEIKNVNSEDVDSQSMPARDQGQRLETCCAKRRRSKLLLFA